ncbi:MAG: nicotinate-nucleotide adenylyltransferase [Candidatus Eiseniibacteriota bacterium]|nr:MAG: nicotinate-nucleotide adenylyltransferase [Candidatus Eisenbacteria bacterium]
MRIGLFGGTFDPIHVGHLIIAEQARESLGLSKVIFVPSGVPPHKHHRRISDAASRLEMTRLAIEGNEHFELSDFEVGHEAASFTVETVHHFKRTLGQQVELFLILGADSILEISTWKEPEKLLSQCRPVVAGRPGYDLGKLEPELRKRVRILEGVLVDVSSTDIRSRVASGRSIRYLVPASVASFISERKLYSGASST